MYLLRMDQLSAKAVESVAASFGRLPTTQHKDGEYRLRRYSQIELLKEPQSFKHIPISSFTQSSQYNKFQGDVERTFENIEQKVLESYGFKEIINLFRTVNQLSVGVLIDVHQMRVITLHDDTPVSPEGLHQDGYECIAMFGIDRHNVQGGELLVSHGNDCEPFVRLPINEGTGVFLDDQAMWHNATDLKPVDEKVCGHMDAFILTANK